MENKDKDKDNQQPKMSTYHVHGHLGQLGDFATEWWTEADWIAWRLQVEEWRKQGRLGERWDADISLVHNPELDDPQTLHIIPEPVKVGSISPDSYRFVVFDISEEVKEKVLDLQKGNKMTVVNLKVEGGNLPQYETEGAAGFDLVATSFKKLYKGQKELDISKLFPHTLKQETPYIVLRAFERVLVGTGLFVEVPSGFEIQVRDRSGNALKKGLLVANAPGTIDSDYRGEVGVILVNNTNGIVKISIGDRVAQGVLTNVEQAVWNVTDNLTDTTRGEGGFGSTDKSINLDNYIASIDPSGQEGQNTLGKVTISKKEEIDSDDESEVEIS